MLQAILLGNAQDAGVPQVGCHCRQCSYARAAGEYAYASSLGLIDSDAGKFFLVDATPDFREQFHQLQSASGQAQFGGLLITHAHMGHYAGLLQLGFEAMAARHVPLYASERFITFLRTNAPWKQLVQHANVTPIQLVAEDWCNLTPSLAVRPLPVPHRDEWSDTLAFLVRGPNRRLLYLPDIDSWDAWSVDVRPLVESCDVVLLDGSFFSRDELPGRDLNKIGHPLVTETVERLRGASADLRFIHLNHSNPLHQPGEQQEWLRARGFRVGQYGDSWAL